MEQNKNTKNFQQPDSRNSNQYISQDGFHENTHVPNTEENTEDEIIEKRSISKYWPFSQSDNRTSNQNIKIRNQ